MARLLMVSANLSEDPYPVYPLGADLIASAVRSASHQVEFIDLLADGDAGLCKALTQYKPDYIAVSMRNVDNVNFDQPQSFVSQYKTLIDMVKEHHSAPIILGGAAFTIFPERFMEYLGADYGIVGPGEVSLPKLIAQLEHGHPPKHAIITGEIDGSGGNDYFLHREQRLADFYLTRGGMLNVYTKRGCPHHCLYCSYPSLEGTRYIFREPRAVVDEIAYLQNNHAADFLFFTDSVFNDAGNQYLQIMEEMARRNIAIPWTCYLRPAAFHPDEVGLMKRTGLYSVEWGSDCASDRTLAGMGKELRWEEVREAHNLFASRGIPGSHFIIFGGPGETPDTVREGVKNLAGLTNAVIFIGTGIRIFPNTGIFELAKRTGVVRDENELFAREVYYHSPGIDVEWLTNFLTESCKEHRNWIFPWAGVAERNRFMHYSGMRGPLWDFLVE